MKAKTLQAGDTVGIFAPGSPCDPKRFHQGVEELHQRGFRTRIPSDPAQSYGSHEHCFSSASVKERVLAFNELVQDEEVSVIIAARGAYGSAELLLSLDFEQLRASRKCLVGSSDVTVLLAAAYACKEICTIHGPTVSGDFARVRDDESACSNVDDLIRLLSDETFRLQAQCEELRPGSGSGPIIAGNLTMLLTLLGTPWDLSYDNAILVLEDIGEAPYRIHRKLLQLKLAGKLRSLSGLVFGRFSRADAAKGPSVDEVIRRSIDDILHDTDYPVLIGLEFGHGGRSHPLPFGCAAEIQDGQLLVLDSPISG